VDVYADVIELVSGLPLIQSWGAMKTMLERAAPHKPRDWQLPVLACQAVGGRPEWAVPAAAAIACLQGSVILIDDMLDNEPDGEHIFSGMGVTANLAAAFQAAGLEAIARSKTPAAARLAALDCLNRAALTTAYGQHLDIQPVADEPAYWRLVAMKSCPFFSVALYAGALMGDAPLEVAQQLGELGRLYGAMIQLHDDLKDVMARPANPDWLEGRSPLPILFAQTINYPERDRFLALRPVVVDPVALAEAQQILIDCGAVSYCVHQLLRHYQVARTHLAAIALERPELIENLFDNLVEPIWMLLAGAGVSHPEAMLAPPPGQSVPEIGALALASWGSADDKRL
jgi:geranylgeranyl diphosphate synthase type I